MVDSHILVIVDLETTGFSMNYDHIIQIAAVVSNPNINTDLELQYHFERQQSLMVSDNNNYQSNVFEAYILPEPNYLISQKIESLTGITNNILQKRGLPFLEAWTRFQMWLSYLSSSNSNKPIVIMAHNGKQFDIPFLHSELMRRNRHHNWASKSNILCFIDSLQLLRNESTFWNSNENDNITKPNSFALGNIYKYLFNEEMSNAHNALYDVNALHKIFEKSILKNQWRKAANKFQFSLLQSFENENNSKLDALPKENDIIKDNN